MSVTTTQLVNCPCCGTLGGCTLCAVETSGTDQQAGLPTVLNVTFYNNFWNLAPVLSFDEAALLVTAALPTSMAQVPYCDCLASGTLDYNSDTYDGESVRPHSAGNMPPLYYPNSPRVGIFSSITFPLVYDPNYVVRLGGGSVGAWVYRQFSCSSLGSGAGTYYAFIIRFWCSGGLGSLSVSWHTSSVGFEGSGTGTGTADMDGDPTTYAGLIWATCTMGNILHPVNGAASYINTCDPPYFVFGTSDIFWPIVAVSGGLSFSGDGPFQGVGPDQTVTGNVPDGWAHPTDPFYDIASGPVFCAPQYITAVVSL